MDKKIDGVIFGRPTVDLRLKTDGSEDAKLVEDLTKRRFIRAIGIVGVGAFLYSLIPKKAQALVFGSGQKTRDNADILSTLALESDGNLEALAGTDFATEATLGTVHGHVDSIDTKTPALGQALASASVPVILPAATITTLTPPAAITGFATETTLSALNTKIPASPATEGGNLASIKAKTDNIPSDPAKESGKLTDIATNTGKITNALAQYKFSDEDSGTTSNVVYRGYIEKDGNWFMVKETISSTSRTYRYAKGDSAYTTSWGNRATSVSYDYFDVIF